MNRNLLFLLFLIYGVFSFAQELDSNSVHGQDGKFLKLIEKKAAVDPGFSLYLADSLFIHSNDLDNQIQALILSSKISTKQKKYTQAVDFGFRALRLSEEKKHNSQCAEIYAWLGELSYELGYTEKAIDFLEKSIDYSYHINDTTVRDVFRAQTFHRLGQFANYKNEPKTGVVYFKRSLAILNDIGFADKDQLLLTNELNLARAFLKMEELGKAKSSTKRSQELLEKLEPRDQFYKALLYENLAGIYQMEGEQDSAYYYLREIPKMVNLDSHPELRKRIYASLSDAHSYKGNTDRAFYYKDRYHSLLVNEIQNQRENVDVMLKLLILEDESLQPVGQEGKADQDILLYIVWGLGGLLALCLIFLFKRNRAFHKLKAAKAAKSGAVQEMATNTSTSETVDTSHGDFNEEEEGAHALVIPEDTLESIRLGLVKFETEQRYLDHEMKFSTMVSLVDTNSKYLHYYLKEIEGKDYSSYINDLRIGYIVEKLRTNDKFKDYKISYLAEKSGFQSQSNFSANFKRLTGKSPSVYVRELVLEEN